jgi:hypothetical protein
VDADLPMFAPVPGAEHQTFGRVEIDIVRVGDARVKRSIYPVGLRWSTDLKPLVGTDSWRHAHAGFLEHAALHCEYLDGCAVELKAPAVLDIAPGHDAWVEGDEPMDPADVASLFLDGLRVRGKRTAKGVPC